MPLVSKSQERALWSKDPEVAQEFEDHTTPEQRANLPEHVGDKKPKKKEDGKTSEEKETKEQEKAACLVEKPSYVELVAGAALLRKML